MHTFFKTIVGSRAHTTWAQSALLAPLIGLLILVGSAVPVRAQTFTFTAVLTSGQEPPPNTNNSPAFGVAFVTFNTDTGELCFSISYEEFQLT
jgi:CHRD domain